MLAAYIFLILLGITIFLAFFRGEREDRVAAICFLGATLSSLVVDSIGWDGTAKPEIGVVIVDWLLLGALIWFALRSNRFWPLWATGFHLVAIFTHLAVWIDMQAVPTAYALALGLWSFPTLGALTTSLITRRNTIIAEAPTRR